MLLSQRNGNGLSTKATSEVYKEENKYQVFMDLEKVHRNGRASKIATLQNSEASPLKGPPKIKRENHTENIRKRGGN